MHVITLPAETATLTQVKEIRLYGSHLRRLPEIRANVVAPELDVYTSYSLALVALRSHAMPELIAVE